MTKGLKQLQEEILGTDACTGCGTCVLCPHLVSIDDRIAVVGDCDIEYGRCYRYCPRTPPDQNIAGKLFGDEGFCGPVGPFVGYCAARSALSDGPGGFQYGGIVSALMVQAIKDGLINRAVVTRAVSNVPMPVTVQSDKEIINAAGSKFALSPTNREANRSTKDPESRIGVVALPCQVTGLRKRQLMPPNDGIAEGKIELIIGLFCTWALSQEGWRSLIRRYAGGAHVTSMDIPPPPATTMEIGTNTERYCISLNDVMAHVRPGCRVCLDMTAENADISVGMVEGRKGYNTVIIRTDLGKRLFERAIEVGCVETDELDDERWRHLNEAATNKKKKAIDETENRAEPLPYYSRILGLRKKVFQRE